VGGSFAIMDIDVTQYGHTYNILDSATALDVEKWFLRIGPTEFTITERACSSVCRCYKGADAFKST